MARLQPIAESQVISQCYNTVLSPSIAFHPDLSNLKSVRLSPKATGTTMLSCKPFKCFPVVLPHCAIPSCDVITDWAIQRNKKVETLTFTHWQYLTFTPGLLEFHPKSVAMFLQGTNFILKNNASATAFTGNWERISRKKILESLWATIIDLEKIKWFFQACKLPALWGNTHTNISESLERYVYFLDLKVFPDFSEKHVRKNNQCK